MLEIMRANAIIFPTKWRLQTPSWITTLWVIMSFADVGYPLRQGTDT